MKTETLTIRLSTEEKQLITNLAWSRHTSVAKLLISLAREANEAKNITVQDAKNELAELAAQIDDLRREVAALAPRHNPLTAPSSGQGPAAPSSDQDLTAPGSDDQMEYMPGYAPQCYACRWNDNGDCTHKDYKDSWDTKTIQGDCPQWEYDIEQ